jgi:cell division protein FtsW (lipid II flippase)
VPVSEVYQSQNATPQFAIPRDNETGRKAYFWYRVYCGVMIVIYLALAGIGITFTFVQPESSSQKPEEVMIMGIIYAVLGVTLLLIFAVAFFLPRTPWNWIVGIVMMALGMTSCCFMPFLIPLLIYWLKPETQAYFGRN